MIGAGSAPEWIGCRVRLGYFGSTSEIALPASNSSLLDGIGRPLTVPGTDRVAPIGRAGRSGSCLIRESTSSRF